MLRKGVILAGGKGTRLYPATLAISKHLLPVYDKPMIYYPLSTLMLAGIRDVLVISTADHIGSYEQLLGDGAQWGISFSYAVQPEPNGIGGAILSAKSYVGQDPFALILGDNIFFAQGFGPLLRSAGASVSGATIFAYRVQNPSEYGVVVFDERGNPVELAEKPVEKISDYAVTGLYFYDNTAIERAKSLVPSPRGEIEITDLNNEYLKSDALRVERLGRGTAWLDTGRHDSLLQAHQFVQTIESRQGLRISCPEEIAWRMEFIDDDQLARLASVLVDSGYGQYLLQVLRDGK